MSDQRDAIEAALKVHLTDDEDPGVVVVKWFTVVEYATTSHDRNNICLVRSNGTSSWDVAGMSDWANARASMAWEDD